MSDEKLVTEEDGFQITSKPAEVDYRYDDDTPYVYVATPAYDNKVDTDFSQSLANALWHAFPFGIHASVSHLANSAFIELSRNIFVAYFLHDPALKDATHLMFIDSDLKFDPKAFVGVVKACREDQPVIAGVYPRRQEELDYPCRLWPEPEHLEKTGEEVYWLDNPEEPRFVMANRVPTGFLCIRRNILEEMAADAVQLDCDAYDFPVPKLFYTQYVECDPPKTLKLSDWYPDADGDVEMRRMMGEDYRWCDDYVARYNRPIPVALGLTFVHGGWEGNYGDYLATLIEEGDGKRRLGQRRGVDVRKAK